MNIAGCVALFVLFIAWRIRVARRFARHERYARELARWWRVEYPAICAMCDAERRKIDAEMAKRAA